jgi:hypothetical protein
VAIERLYRGVDVENPWLTQQRAGGVIEMFLQPRQAGTLLDPVEAAAHRILTHQLVHPQQRRIDRVAAQRRDVGVAPMPGQHREHHGAEDITLVRSVRACVFQRAIRYKVVEHRAQLEKIDEERQLAKRRQRRAAVPFDMDRPGKGIGDHRPEGIGDHRPGRCPLYHRLLTRREPRQLPMFLAHPS